MPESLEAVCPVSSLILLSPLTIVQPPTESRPEFGLADPDSTRANIRENARRNPSPSLPSTDDSAVIDPAAIPFARTVVPSERAAEAVEPRLTIRATLAIESLGGSSLIVSATFPTYFGNELVVTQPKAGNGTVLNSVPSSSRAWTPTESDTNGIRSMSLVPTTIPTAGGFVSLMSGDGDPSGGGDPGGCGCVPADCNGISGGLDIVVYKYDNTTAYSETKEDEIGGIVLKKVDYPPEEQILPGARRQKITIGASITDTGVGGGVDPDCAVTLTRSNNNVKIYESDSGNTESSYEYTLSDLDPPKILWVEGVSESENMRDITLTLSAPETDLTPDTVKFTVAWGGKPTIRGFGQNEHVSDDNTAKNTYIQINDANDDKLGKGVQYTIDQVKNIGWGLETKSVLAPNDFAHPDAIFKIGRAVERGRHVQVPGFQLISQYLQLVYEESSPQMQSNDPTSSNPLGKIYDLDIPGRARTSAPVGTIYRLRQNFFDTAVFLIEGTRYQGSFVEQHYVSQSWEQKTNPDGIDWQYENTYNNNGDNKAGLGEIYLTPDLQDP